MKRILISLLAVLVIVHCRGQQWRNDSHEQQKIAVYVTEKDSQIADLVNSRFVATSMKHGGYEVVERKKDFLDLLEKEVGYQLGGNVDDKQIVRVGKQLGVDIVCAITISYGNYIDARLINVETAAILTTVNGRLALKSARQLEYDIDVIAARLFGIKLPDKKIYGFHLVAEGFFSTDDTWGGVMEMGCRFNNYLAVSAGSGYITYTNKNCAGTIVPLFVSVRINVLHYMLSPYVAVAGGAGFDFYTNTDTYITTHGTITHPSEHKAVWGYYQAVAGLHLRCSDTFAIHAGACYNNITNAPVVIAGIAFTL